MRTWQWLWVLGVLGCAASAEVGPSTGTGGQAGKAGADGSGGAGTSGAGGMTSVGSGGSASDGGSVDGGGGMSSPRRTFHASPTGTGAACSVTLPCSITQAQTAVRQVVASMQGDLVVQLADGVYRLTAPLAFTVADSGGNGHRVTWQAAPSSHPVISGGQRITGWTMHDAAKNIWQATVGTGLDARQLYVDGLLATRARAAFDRKE